MKKIEKKEKEKDNDDDELTERDISLFCGATED